jgi:ABC-type Fe3+-hydroxamate transport system substrate-binding protein
MSRTLVTSAILLGGVLLVLPGCGQPSTAEDADFQRLFKSLAELFDQMDTVKDSASAKAARPKLDELDQTIRDLHQKVKAIPDGKRKKLYERHSQLVRAAQEKHVTQTLRLMGGDLPNDIPAFHYLMVVAEVVEQK